MHWSKFWCLAMAWLAWHASHHLFYYYWMIHVPIHNHYITFSILDSQSSILDSHVSKLKCLYLCDARMSFQGLIESFSQLQLLCEILYKYVASCSLFFKPVKGFPFLHNFAFCSFFWKAVKSFSFLQNLFLRTFYCLYKGNASCI